MMIFPRQILYGAELIKSYFSIPFINLSKINNKFHKCFKLKKDKKIIFTSKGRTALYLILKYLKIYKWIFYKSFHKRNGLHLSLNLLLNF